MIGRGGNFSRSMSISSNKEYTTPEAEMVGGGWDVVEGVDLVAKH